MSLAFSFFSSLRKENKAFFQNIVDNLDLYDLEDVCSWIGIEVPSPIHKYYYIYNNILSYLPIVKRAEDYHFVNLNILNSMNINKLYSHVSSLKDSEIHKQFGVKVGYRTREEHINYSLLSLKEKTFFIPVTTSFSVNTHTMLGTDINDEEIIFVGYGTIFEYVTYELDEMFNSFYESNGLVIFRKPDNINLSFSFDDIVKLILLMETYIPYQDRVDITKRILKGLQDNTIKIEESQKCLDTFSSFDNKIKSSIGNYLLNVFYSGMCMRRWKGPGYKYPLRESETLQKFCPDNNVSLLINKGFQLLKSMDCKAVYFCNSLRVFQCASGKIIEATEDEMEIRTLTDLIENTANGSICMRMASTLFIGTSYYFLNTLMDYSIPDFEIESLDTIQ